VLAVAGLVNLLVLFGLTRALAPDFTAAVIERATSLVTVTVTTYEEPEAEPSMAPPQPDEGAAGDEGKKAKAREVSAPPNPVPRPSPAPRAASTGNANQSGARESGEGTGAGGEGDGTGSGRRGSGSGGAVAVGPTVRSGELNEARDFPTPQGGRQTRFGRSVVVHFTVGVDGRAKNCSVASSGVDAETTALVCPLVMQKIRFNPATTAEGRPVEARYGYRVDFRARS
jgi:protein TonB